MFQECIPSRGKFVQVPFSRLTEESFVHVAFLGWKCPCCTFVNIPTRPGCEQCASSRPANYTMPANFAIDDIERLRLEQEAFQEQLTHNASHSNDDI